MKEFLRPARADTAIEIGPYQFLKQDGTPFPLTSYSSVLLEVKLRGELYDEVAGAFVNQTTGIVNVPVYNFVDDGVWQVQFVAVMPSGQRTYGEPAQLRVAKNVRDLALTELLRY